MSFAKISLFGLVIGLLSLTVAAQTIVSELNGFRLTQFRSTTHCEFGEPDMVGSTNEELDYEAFLLKDDQSLYIVFQYRKSEPEIIYSIQITGTDNKYDHGFRGLRFGDTANQVEKVLGRPSRKVNAGEHGTRWEFDKANYSIEISKQNSLSSIRIVDERSEGGDPKFDKVPKFIEVARKLQVGTNAEIAEILAPDMEVYEAGKVLYFKRSFRNEVTSDNSGVFAAIRRMSKELSTVDLGKAGELEENLRLSQGRIPNPVIKLYKLKGVTEIVFRWDGRRWLIWEFGAAKPADGDSSWMNNYKPGSLKDLATTQLQALLKTPNVSLKGSDGKPFADFSYNSYPTRAKVMFTGESRKTLASTLTLIELWLTTIGRSKEEAKLFETEYKFTEDGVDHWLPVQSTLIEHFPKKIKKGDEIMIYVAWMGIKYDKEVPRSLTIVNEFTTFEQMK